MNLVRTARYLLAVGAAGLGSACGDPADIQVPLPLAGFDAQPAVSPASAVLMLEGSGTYAACDAFRTSLPNPGAQETLLNGAGQRLMSSAGSRVECRVASLSVDAPGVFDVELRVDQEGGLPHFELRGRVSDAGRATLTLSMSLADGDSIQSECSGEVKAVLPGALWVPSFSCEDTRSSDSPVDCRLEGGVIFEKCER